jgi:CRP-like cAMP-binding protein
MGVRRQPSSLSTRASSLVTVEIPAGEVVIREGEEGDRFYVVERGQLTVEAHGVQGETLHPGAYFGEIALLRSSPRSATVRTDTAVTLLALERDDFIAAVTGHVGSKEAADAVIPNRLRTLRPTVAAG